jgi:hypothetical protein
MATTPLHIEHPEAWQLATQIAQHTGKTLEQVVVDALRHESERVVVRRWDEEKISEILAEAHALPDIDHRSAREIIEELYDDEGLIR